MSTQGIQLADLSHIFRTLNELNNGLVTVAGGVAQIDDDLTVTRSELQALSASFAEFVAVDARAKELQLAETRHVKVRQELDTKFGHYATVRRHATGILQASDVSLVRQETLSCATEEMMLDAPRYWLAPALVALAAWLGDNQTLAEKAAREAMRRDDEKTSLFFSLIGRRAGRSEVCKKWLERYFAMQDPHALDRQSVVLVDALASGVFGVEVRQACSTQMATWVNELSQQPTFVAEQRQQWADALLSKMPTTDDSGDFRTLATHCRHWNELQASLNSARIHAAILEHFRRIFEEQTQPSPSLQTAVDDLLDKLVTNFDDEELPLRRLEQELSLIVESGGDKKAAQAKMNLTRTALEERVSFMQLLTNAAMHPEHSHASIDTQRLAISVSRHWIKEAYGDIVAALRQKLPTRVTIEIEGWSGETSDGSNQTALLDSLRAHFENLKLQRLASLQFSPVHWVGVALSVLMLILSFNSLFFGFLGVVGLVCLFLVHNNLQNARAKAETDHATFMEACESRLKACLSDLVEWRRAYAQHDAVSQELSALFERLSPSQHIQTQHDTARQIVR